MLHPVEVAEVDVLLRDDRQNRREEDSLNPAIRIPGFLDLDPVGCMLLRNGAIVDGEAKEFFTLQGFFFFI